MSRVRPPRNFPVASGARVVHASLPTMKAQLNDIMTTRLTAWFGVAGNHRGYAGAVIIMGA
jgi:hypothetical protein